MNNSYQEQQNNNRTPKSRKFWRWINKFSWLLFIKGTISFQGIGWKVELQYQPFTENRIFTELVQNLNSIDQSKS